MRIISTRTHGVLDYVVGILLIGAPFILGFADGTAAMWVPIILGIATLLLAFCTNFELGAIKAIPMGVHLTIDLFCGVFLAGSPWIFDFKEVVWVPHVLVGLLVIGTGCLTQRVPAHATSGRRSA